jgi:hypothetical protein
VTLPTIEKSRGARRDRAYVGCMAHAMIVDGTRSTVHGRVDLGRDHGRLVLRIEPLPNGDTVVVAPAGARIDGRPMLGGLAVVDWGRGAIVRAGGLRVELVWEAAREVRRASAPGRCACCLDPIAAGEVTMVCTCETAVHDPCARAMISCQTCGEAA